MEKKNFMLTLSDFRKNKKTMFYKVRVKLIRFWTLVGNEVFRKQVNRLLLLN